MQTSSRWFMVLACSFLAACAGDGSPSTSKRTIRVAEMMGSVALAEEDREKFTTELNQALYAEAFDKGSEFTLLWRIAHYERGSGALHHITEGIGGGKSVFVAEAKVLDSQKNVIGSGSVEGEGSFDKAISEAADQAAELAANAVYPGQ